MIDVPLNIQLQTCKHINTNACCTYSARFILNKWLTPVITWFIPHQDPSSIVMIAIKLNYKPSHSELGHMIVYPQDVSQTYFQLYQDHHLLTGIISPILTMKIYPKTSPAPPATNPSWASFALLRLHGAVDLGIRWAVTEDHLIHTTGRWNK